MAHSYTCMSTTHPLSHSFHPLYLYFCLVIINLYCSVLCTARPGPMKQHLHSGTKVTNNRVHGKHALSTTIARVPMFPLTYINEIYVNWNVGTRAIYVGFFCCWCLGVWGFFVVIFFYLFIAWRLSACYVFARPRYVVQSYVWVSFWFNYIRGARSANYVLWH